VPFAMRATAVLTLVTVAGIALATSAATPDEGTVANLAYGRYLGCLAPALFLAGAAFVVRATRTGVAKVALVTAGLLLASALWVVLHAAGRLTHAFYLSLDFPEMSALTWSWDHLRFWWVTAVVLLSLLSLVLAKGRKVGRVLVALVVAADVAAVAVIVGRDARYWANTIHNATSLADVGLRPDDRVGIDYRDMSWRVWISQAFQVQSHLEAIDRRDSRTLPQDLTLVIVPWDVQQPPRASWPAAPPDFAPISIHSTDSGSWVAWRRL
jgi:hypothetical protein